MRDCLSLFVFVKKGVCEFVGAKVNEFQMSYQSAFDIGHTIIIIISFLTIYIIFTIYFHIFK